MTEGAKISARSRAAWWECWLHKAPASCRMWSRRPYKIQSRRRPSCWQASTCVSAQSRCRAHGTLAPAPGWTTTRPCCSAKRSSLSNATHRRTRIHRTGISRTWRTRSRTQTLGLFSVATLCGSVAEWLGRWTCDQQVASSNPGLPALECNPGQVVNTHVPLSPSSIIRYQPMGGDDALRLGR